MDKLPLPRKGMDQLPAQPQLLDKYDKGGAELHTDELLAAADGTDLQNSHEIEQLRFPEPKKHVKQIK